MSGDQRQIARSVKPFFSTLYILFCYCGQSKWVFSLLLSLPSRHMQMLKSQSEEDAVSLDSLINDKQQFLGKAVQNYILCLKTGVR